MANNFDAQWGSFVYKIAEANKPFILNNADIDDAEVYMKADENNQGTINVCGDYGVTVGGWGLAPNQEFPPIRIAKAQKIYVSGSVAGDILHVMYSGGINGNTNKLLASLLIELRDLNRKIK